MPGKTSRLCQGPSPCKASLQHKARPLAISMALPRSLDPSRIASANAVGRWSRQNAATINCAGGAAPRSASQRQTCTSARGGRRLLPTAPSGPQGRGGNDRPPRAPRELRASPTRAPHEPHASPTSGPRDPHASPTRAPREPHASPTGAPREPYASPREPNRSPVRAPGDPCQRRRRKAGAGGAPSPRGGGG